MIRNADGRVQHGTYWKAAGKTISPKAGKRLPLFHHPVSRFEVI